MGAGHLQHMQMLRALAALGVVIDHAIHLGSHAGFPVLLHWEAAADLVGETGVGAFFVLSGVIMAGQTQDSRLLPAPARHFLLRRLGRIVPMYWLATAAALVVFTAPSHTQAHILQSLLFIPYPTGTDRPYPVLFQGWTLEYEMMFYLLCTLSLLMRRTAGEALLLAAPCLLAVLHRLHPFGAGGYGAVLFNLVTDPLCLLFAAGVAAGSIKRRQPSPGGTTGFYPALLLLAPMAVVVAIPGQIAALGHGIDVLGDAAGGAVVLGCLFCPRPRIGPFGRFLVALGDASYSTYLSHTMVLMLLLHALPWLGQAWGGTAAFLLLGTLLAVAGGVVLHDWVEKPLLRAVRRPPGGSPLLGPPGCRPAVAMSLLKHDERAARGAAGRTTAGATPSI